MPFLQTLLHHPRKLFLRRALFQIHLWLGILLSVYVALIGVSGSILVFEDEFRAHALRDLHPNMAHLASARHVLDVAQVAYPGETATFLSLPSVGTRAYTVYLAAATNAQHAILADAATGSLLPRHSRLLVDWVHDFHVNLLLGQTGFIVNCVAGIGLLVLTFTGVVLWWNGLRTWMRGLRINLRANWKRINYDAHNIIGIATLLIVSFWGVSSVYFLFPAQTASAISFISPLRGMKPPAAPDQPAFGAGADLDVILQQAAALTPHGTLSGASLPATEGDNIIVYVDRTPGDFSHRDIYTFSGTTGRLLSTWHYGSNRTTAADWILWAIYPLHFGTTWGLAVKVVWAILGLSLPTLALTGLLMYWNRFLGKRWRHFSGTAQTMRTTAVRMGGE